ncbi:MAG: right-handed parallel beta-helix repeat-containing protein [Candidatus Desulforudis sp.]|nr:right-handed parallel beta-helix repeat-containing protein [Desulforudis sp.]
MSNGEIRQAQTRSFVIQDAIDAAAPGATVVVPPGTYNEQLIIDKPLTLTGPDPAVGVAIVDAAGMAAVPTIHILAGDVTVNRLTIENGPLHGIRAGSAAFPNLTNIVITNNIIRGHGNAGVLTNHGAAMHIENNVIEDNGQGTGFNRVGVVLFPHGASQVIGNTIKNNTIDGIFARASSSGLLIEDNDIEDHLNSGVTLVWDERNVTIRDNRIKNAGIGGFDETGGIVIIQSMAEEISGNTIKNCNRSGIFWGWVPSTGPAPAEILITNNRIEDSARDAIYLFSMGPGGWIPPDPFPLEPLIQGNSLKNSVRAGVYVSNLYYYSPGNANPTIHFNNIENNTWGVFNATAKTVDGTNNWWGDASGPFHLTLNPTGLGDPVSDRIDFIPWLGEPVAVCVDPTGNCADCCAIFTDEELREAFGYQEEEATCQCHDICVPDVKLICVEELTHETPIPGIDSVVGCRGGRNITGLLTLESCRVFCAQETLVQTGDMACLQVDNEVGVEVILSVEVNGETVFLVVRDVITLECLFTKFHEFPSGDGFQDTPEDRAAFRDIIKFIDGSCKTMIIEDCRVVNTENPRVEVDLKVIDKLWKHENLLVSAIRPYPEENITVKQEFNNLHKIFPCNNNNG